MGREIGPCHDGGEVQRKAMIQDEMTKEETHAMIESYGMIEIGLDETIEEEKRHCRRHQSQQQQRRKKNLVSLKERSFELHRPRPLMQCHSEIFFCGEALKGMYWMIERQGRRLRDEPIDEVELLSLPIPIEAFHLHRSIQSTLVVGCHVVGEEGMIRRRFFRLKKFACLQRLLLQPSRHHYRLNSAKG